MRLMNMMYPGFLADQAVLSEIENEGEENAKHAVSCILKNSKASWCYHILYMIY
jgi:hypothetical protein